MSEEDKRGTHFGLDDPDRGVREDTNEHGGLDRFAGKPAYDEHGRPIAAHWCPGRGKMVRVSGVLCSACHPSMGAVEFVRAEDPATERERDDG